MSSCALLESWRPVRSSCRFILPNQIQTWSRSVHTIPSRVSQISSSVLCASSAQRQIKRVFLEKQHGRLQSIQRIRACPYVVCCISVFRLQLCCLGTEWRNGAVHLRAVSPH